MTNATIIDYKKYLDGHLDVTVNMFFNVPTALLLSGSPISNTDSIAESYGFGFDGTYITKTETFASAIPIVKNSVLSQITTRWTQLNTQITNLTLTAYDKIIGTSWNGSTWS